MNEVTRYLRRAVADTRPHLAELVLGIVSTAITALVQASISPERISFLVPAIAGASAALVTFLVRFLHNLWLAPGRVTKEDTTFLEEAYERALTQLDDARRQLDLLDSEELDVDVTLSMYTDATFLNVHNNEESDQFVCEVIGWGQERPLSRTHFPWKVKWEESDTRFCEISHGTSGRLFLAKIERAEAQDAFPNEPHPRKLVSLFFVTPEEEKLLAGRSYLTKDDFEPLTYFVRLLISGHRLSRATHRTVELRVIHDMEDDFEQRSIIQRPVLRARLED